jgi:hypothetical protein
MLPRGLRESFTGAIRRMLRPVVRQLVAWGVPYPAFDRLVRELYVEVAEGEFQLPFKRQTDSRISLVTGLNRKEIARLRRQRAASTETARPAEEAIATRVVGRWLAPPYVDRSGRPRPLAYEAEGRREASFTRLVRSLALDVPARSVLDELIRSGLVELHADGQVALLRQANIPEGDPTAKLELLASDPAELFTTIVHNLERPDAAWLQRKVVYDNIGADALPILRTAAREAGEEFMRIANRLLAANDRDRNPRAPGGRRSRVVLGAYYFEADGPERAPDSAQSSTGAVRSRPRPEPHRRPRRRVTRST